MKNIKDTIRENLKLLRESCGMTGHEFAKKCHIHQRTYNRIENGENWPHLEIIELIAKHNDLAPWQLLVPGFSPAEAPVLKNACEIEQAFYDRINYLLNNPQ